MKCTIKWASAAVILILFQLILQTSESEFQNMYSHLEMNHDVYYCDVSYSLWSTCIINNFTYTDPEISTNKLYFDSKQNENGYDYDSQGFDVNVMSFISCNFSQPTITILTKNTLNNVYEVDLSETHIRELKKFNAPNVRALRLLILSRNKIEKLVEPSIFNDHPTLTTIDLSFNRIHIILPEAFEGLKELQRLSLNNNEIKEIDGQMFRHIHDLINLDLSCNQIESIRNDSFVALKRLKVLYLNENQFATFDMNDLKYNAMLSVLYVGNNSDFTSLSEDFNFREAYLGATLNVSKVVVADFVVNNSYVFITNSKISSVKLGSEVNTIKANNCRLTKVTFEYANSKLMIVDFSNNYLSGDLQFDNLTSLHTLDVSLNQIANISFANSSALINLNLSKNNLTNIQSLSSISKLKKLDISENCIQDFHLGTFGNMHNLEVLVLRKTCFQSLDFGTFSYQKSLQVLDISYNNLKRLDLDFFTFQTQLKDLFIDGNNLTDIQSIDLISIHLPNLRSIALSHNAWNCSTLSSIIKILNQLKVNAFVEDVVQNKTNIKGIACSTVSLNSTQQSIITPQNPILVDHTTYINKIEKINEIVERINEINSRRKNRQFSDNSLRLEISNLENHKNRIKNKFDNQMDDMNVATKEILNKYKLSMEINYNASMELKAIVQKINDTNSEKYKLLLKRIDSLGERLTMIKLKDDVKYEDKFKESKKNINFNSKYYDDIESIKSLEIYSIVFLFLLIILALYYAWFKC